MTLSLNRVTRLIGGLVLFGIAIALIVRAEIGVTPWDVLSQGVSNVTGLTFGMSTMVISGIVLLLWIPLKEKIGWGTLVNVLIVGPVADLCLWLIPEMTPLLWRIPTFGLGLVILALGTGIYLSAAWSPGPRDGLMTGLHTRTGWPIGIVRSGIEIAVLIVGAFMGGNLGWGTLAFALLIGPLCGVTIPLFARKWN